MTKPITTGHGTTGQSSTGHGTTGHGTTGHGTTGHGTTGHGTTGHGTLEPDPLATDERSRDTFARAPARDGSPPFGRTPASIEGRSPGRSAAPPHGGSRRPKATSEATQRVRVSRIGRYTLLEKIGQGGMGAVYRAYDPTSERTVAVKVLLWGTMANRLERQRFLLEARAAALLNHPGIVRVLDTGVHEGCPYFTMEYVDGPSMRDVLEKQGPFPVEEALQMLAHIATAVHYAHGRGIVHRDIKPANILLQEGALPRVIDFGIAGYECEDLDGLGASERGGGTPQYMSPEQAGATSAHISHLSDVYSLGALFFHMVMGHPPPTGLSGGAPKRTHASRELAQHKSSTSTLLAEALHLCAKAMAINPSHRYRSALELAQEAERLLGARSP